MRQPLEDRLLEIIKRSDQPLSIEELLQSLKIVPRRTLQRSLKSLVAQNQIETLGNGRARRYRARFSEKDVSTAPLTPISLGPGANEIRSYVTLPIQSRKPVGYERHFLDAYQPNKIYYLSEKLRQHLRALGTKISHPQPAGTYARQIYERLLIDLSWNSSRLEGNTYSLLDTERLIKFGEQAANKSAADAQMILNHKDAIELLVESTGELQINSFTIRNLHALLSQNLLPNPAACGQLREIEVRIGKSVYMPLIIPAQIKEIFEQLLSKAQAIQDEFEQAFFLLVHLPYLQPFEDVNKRVSRLSANIPLMRANLCPLSFVDVPEDLYIEGLLGVYEMNRIELMQDVFVWAYERSVQRYDVIKTNVGDPDPFRLKYRQQISTLISDTVKNQQNKTYIHDWISSHIPVSDQEQFSAVVDQELNALHEGNISRYRLKLAEFEAWRLSKLSK